VTLLFAEVYWGGPPCGGSSTGSRVFSIALEGATVLAGYNETVDDGGCAAGTGHPVDKSFVIPISDGALDIAMAATVDTAALNAIELVEQ
jgi:Malectin domain